jgi:hypothetical protein
MQRRQHNYTAQLCTLLLAKQSVSQSVDRCRRSQIEFHLLRFATAKGKEREGEREREKEREREENEWNLSYIFSLDNLWIPPNL